MVNHHTILRPLNITLLLDCIVQCVSNFLICLFWGWMSKLERTERELKEGICLLYGQRFEVLKNIISAIQKVNMFYSFLSFCCFVISSSNKVQMHDGSEQWFSNFF